jgi:hypothetical protein
MRRKTARTAGVALWLALGSLAPARPALAAAQPVPVAAFDFELIDTSLEGEMQGPREDEQRRLRLISDQLRQALSASGRYVVVDLAPARERIADAGYLHGCPGCAATIARSLGAELAITGTVQKVNNLILINLYISTRPAGAAARDEWHPRQYRRILVARPIYLAQRLLAD